MLAYTGRYRVEGHDFITTVEVSWNEEWNGTEQRRHFRIEGNRLFIESARVGKGEIRPPVTVDPAEIRFARKQYAWCGRHWDICRAEPPGDQRLGFLRRPDGRRICRWFLSSSSFPLLSTSRLSVSVCLAQFRGRRASRRAVSDGCA
jgi:hypothetical protein